MVLDGGSCYQILAVVDGLLRGLVWECERGLSPFTIPVRGSGGIGTMLVGWRIGVRSFPVVLTPPANLGPWDYASDRSAAKSHTQ